MKELDELRGFLETGREKPFLKRNFSKGILEIFPDVFSDVHYDPFMRYLIRRNTNRHIRPNDAQYSDVMMVYFQSLHNSDIVLNIAISPP